MIDQIKKDMKKWYSFDLSNDQINEYVEKSRIKCFDTLEREEFVNYLANKIIGMDWPITCDTEDYKRNFYKKLAENALNYGYSWLK